MTTELQFRVYGVPGAQGSKVRTKYGMRESSAKVAPWRQDVVAAALDAVRNQPDFECLTGPVAARIVFFFARPKSHYRTGKHAGELKPDAPIMVITKPDGDKVLRSTYDALTTSGVWRDDSLVARGSFEKRYDTLPGAHISLTALAVTE